LSFSAERDLMGTKFTIRYKLKVKEDKLTGKAEADIGDQKVELDIQGERQKKDK
jgi:hypothetical protein